MHASHMSVQIMQGATKMGFWASREYSSGALNPKVVLGEMGGSGGKGLTERTQEGMVRHLVDVRGMAGWDCPAHDRCVSRREEFSGAQELRRERGLWN